MPEMTIVYWRDIPAQVIAGRGRRAEKHPLPERFEQAIDRAAMAAGATGTDDYLADWRRESVEAESARALAEQLDTDYTQEALKRLIAAHGRAQEDNT